MSHAIHFFRELCPDWGEPVQTGALGNSPVPWETHQGPFQMYVLLPVHCRRIGPRDNMYSLYQDLPGLSQTNSRDWSSGQDPYGGWNMTCGEGIQTKQHVLLTYSATEDLRAQCPATLLCKNTGEFTRCKPGICFGHL